jgi:hypothetical protein
MVKKRFIYQKSQVNVNDVFKLGRNMLDFFAEFYESCEGVVYKPWLNYSQRKSAVWSQLDAPGWFCGAGCGFECEAGYSVAESRRIMDSQKAGLIDIDEVQVCYPVILTELFKYRGGKGQQGVAVFCEPGVFNIRIILYEMGCFADESGIRCEELVKIARDIVESGLDVISDVFSL